MIHRQVAHYLIQEQLGAGGMGVVYRATDTHLGRDVALKFLPMGHAGGEANQRFIREARAAAALNHPNICTIHDLGEHEGQRFIAMELLDGSSLKELISAGPIRPSLVLQWGADIASALDAAHGKGIIHRDIKPANIVVTRDGRVKVLDFGIAKLHAEAAERDVTAAQMTAPGEVVGTLAYMSPEALLGEAVDHRSDLFSLGAVLFEMCTATAPFRAASNPALVDAILHATPPNPIRLNPDVPPALDAIVIKALEKDPALRYQHASDLRADLMRVAARTTTNVVPAAVVSRPRRRSHIAWAAVAAAIVVAVVAVFLISNRQAEALGEADVILLGDITNLTGDPVFDGTLRQAVAVKLEESPFLNIFPEPRVRESLRFMNRPVDSPLTMEVAREVCQRQQLKAMLTGEISAVGRNYAMVLHAVECASGATLARELSEAAAKEQVLTAIGAATTALRERLGESLATIQQLDTPIMQATTSSLDALKALSQGDALRARGERLEALTMYRRAVELDPEFALAHARLGTLYDNFLERERSRESRTRAFELRERASERERFYIDSHYYSNVARDHSKARSTYEQWRQVYPRDTVPVNNLGVLESQFGRFDRSAAAYRVAIELDPSMELFRTNLINSLMVLGQFDEAERELTTAFARLPPSPGLRAAQFLLACAREDRSKRDELSAAAGDEPPVSFLAARSLAAEGRLKESRARLLRAAAGVEQRGFAENAAGLLAEQADSEAAFGLHEFTREIRPRVERMSRPGSLPRRILASAIARDHAGPRHGEWIPPASPLADPPGLGVADAVVRARVALDAERPREAVDALRPHEDMLVINGAGAVALMAYGEALLASGDAKGALAQFTRLIKHRGLEPHSVEHSVVWAWLGRAHVRAGDVDAARRAYETFLKLMERADDNVPLVAQAKAEYGKLP